MKKVLVFMFAALMLAGCTVSPAGTTAAPTAEPTAEAAETAVPDEPEETAAAGTEEETQMIEAVLEEELPQYFWCWLCLRASSGAETKTPPKRNPRRARRRRAQ